MADSIEQLANQLGAQLKKRALKLVTAESCTGGGLSYGITSIPGSSEWFERGLITYSNLAKMELLGVLKATLHSYGSVSEQTAREMAMGALKNSAADISVAITGIAGPDGGTLDKPVGTVWIAVAGVGKETEAEQFLFTGDRQKIREKSIEEALKKLLAVIPA